MNPAATGRLYLTIVRNGALLALVIAVVGSIVGGIVAGTGADDAKSSN